MLFALKTVKPTGGNLVGLVAPFLSEPLTPLSTSRNDSCHCRRMARSLVPIPGITNPSLRCTKQTQIDGDSRSHLAYLWDPGLHGFPPDVSPQQSRNARPCTVALAMSKTANMREAERYFEEKHSTRRDGVNSDGVEPETKIKAVLHRMFAACEHTNTSPLALFFTQSTPSANSHVRGTLRKQSIGGRR